MIQIFNNKESELICKTIDKNGKFYSLFKCEGYYASYLCIVDENKEDISEFYRLFSDREGSATFFIDMEKYIQESTCEINIVDGKKYILSVIDDYCKFHDDYDKMEGYLEGSWEVKRGLFNYFYPESYVEKKSDKIRIEPQDIEYTGVKEKGPIEVDLDFLNDI